MYVRKLKSPNGKTYIQVIDKSSGKYKVIKSLGSAKDKKSIENLINEGKQWINNYKGQQEFDFSGKSKGVEDFFDSIKQLKLVGIDLLIGKIYDEIGFNTIDNYLLRYLIISRIANPTSKLKTTDYLRRYYQIDLDEDKIYRYLDKLYKEQKEQIQQISVIIIP